MELLFADLFQWQPESSISINNIRVMRLRLSIALFHHNNFAVNDASIIPSHFQQINTI